MQNRFISIKEASTILGVSKATLRNWDNSGKLKALRHPFNNYRVYKAEEIENLIDLIETNQEIITQKKNEIRKLAIRHLEEEEDSTENQD